MFYVFKQLFVRKRVSDVSGNFILGGVIGAMYTPWPLTVDTSCAIFVFLFFVSLV